MGADIVMESISPPHLVKGDFVFGGKCGGGKQPTSPKKVVLRRPI